jgi:hypothetical protein
MAGHRGTSQAGLQADIDAKQDARADAEDDARQKNKDLDFALGQMAGHRT